MTERQKKRVIVWLMTGAVLIFSMVIIGGITRLTHSGLSMVEWKPIMGVLPPMNEVDWQEAFNKYKAYPEFQKINYDFGLEEFKGIFWWEYIHRTLGRIIGIVFIIPFLFFVVKKWLDPPLLGKCLILFALGGLQGFLGWYMVMSGLSNDPHVSHYRLALHLVTATILFGYILWVLFGLIAPHQTRSRELKPFARLTKWLLAIILLQIIYGAFVAGLKAGMVYNTFPKMGDRWVAEGVTAMSPFWINFTEGLAGVQFAHRYIAYIVVFLIGFIWLKARHLNLSRRRKTPVHIMLVLVTLQFILGVLTLLLAVPIEMAVLHQAGAMLLFGSAVFAHHQFR